MKKLICVLLVFLLCAALVGCVQSAVFAPYKGSSEEHGGDSQSFEYGRVRTNGYHDRRAYPRLAVITSLSELNGYCRNTDSDYSLERFNEYVKKYDDSFFVEKLLVLIVLQEGSGSIGHSVTSVLKNGNSVLVSIDRRIPEVGTCDMAQWHIIVELDKTLADCEFSVNTH